MPWLLVDTVKTLWHSHKKNEGRKYGGTSRDLREAKEWLQVNEWEPGDVTAIAERFDRFMESDFEGWQEQDYPIWAFLKHYGRYAPPRTERPRVKVQTETHRMVIWCNRCGQNHRADEACPLRIAQ